MSDQEDKDNSRVVSVKKESEPATSEEQTLNILLQKAIGTEGTPDLTSAQVDEILSQQRQVKGYIHDDRKRESYDSKFYLVVILSFVLIFSALVLWKYPDAFKEMLGLLVGLFGGGVGGYGLGKKSS